VISAWRPQTGNLHRLADACRAILGLGMFVPMELSRVLILDTSAEQFITLTERNGARSFAIRIGTPEALAIERRLHGDTPVRPQTHDLLDSVIRALGASLERVVIHKFEQETYFASLLLRRGDDRIEVDARPSDAIALAVAHDVDLEVAEEVLAEVAEERREIEPPIESGEDDDDE
jgi:bifunctional DNase/RNase